MYYRHFGLDGPPFRFTSSPTAVYLGAAHRECLAALEWGLLHDQCGFMLLLGETGTGKTTLLNIGPRAPASKSSARLRAEPEAQLPGNMRVILPQLGVATNERGKLELIQALERAVANRPEGSRTAIIIDEAQNLSDETLEDLRLLANTVGARDRELQIRPDGTSRAARSPLRTSSAATARANLDQGISARAQPYREHRLHRLPSEGAKRIGANLRTHRA